MELHQGKVNVNYAVPLQGWLMGCFARRLGFLLWHPQILAWGTVFVQEGVLLGILILFVSGCRVKM